MFYKTDLSLVALLQIVFFVKLLICSTLWAFSLLYLTICPAAFVENSMS